jgi:hypothetical protein
MFFYPYNLYNKYNMATQGKEYNIKWKLTPDNKLQLTGNGTDWIPYNNNKQQMLPQLRDQLDIPVPEPGPGPGPAAGTGTGTQKMLGGKSKRNRKVKNRHTRKNRK